MSETLYIPPETLEALHHKTRTRLLKLTDRHLGVLPLLGSKKALATYRIKPARSIFNNGTDSTVHGRLVFDSDGYTTDEDQGELSEALSRVPLAFACKPFDGALQYVSLRFGRLSGCVMGDMRRGFYVELEDGFVLSDEWLRMTRNFTDDWATLAWLAQPWEWTWWPEARLKADQLLDEKVERIASALSELFDARR